MAVILSLINNKGGTGKTTTVLHLGGALAADGYKVLLVDLDVQCNLSKGTGVIQRRDEAKNHVGKLLLGETSFEQTVRRSERIGLDVLPSHDPEIITYELKVNSDLEGPYMLRQVLEQVADQYDYILIDCPGNLGPLTANALIASHYFIIPIQGENFAYEGLEQILGTALKVVRSRMNPTLKLAGVLPVKFNRRTRFGKAVLEHLTQHNIKLFQSEIRQDIGLMESPSHGESIFQHTPGSHGAVDFKNLAKEILTLQ